MPRWGSPTSPADSRRLRGSLISVGTLAFLACLWEVAADLRLVPTAALPPLHVIVARGALMLGPHASPPFALELDVVATLERLFAGFLAAALVGIPLAIGIAFRPWLRQLVLPIFSVVLPIPALAFVPILMLITGLGERTDYAVVFITAIIPIVMVVYNGVQALPKVYYWTAGSVGADARFVFLHVTIPGAVLPIVSAMRVGFAYAWRSLVATEGITALAHGLGYTIFQANNFFDTPTVYVYMIAIALLGLAIERLFLSAVERTTVERWGLLAHGA